LKVRVHLKVSFLVVLRLALTAYTNRGWEISIPGGPRDLRMGIQVCVVVAWRIMPNPQGECRIPTTPLPHQVQECPLARTLHRSRDREPLPQGEHFLGNRLAP
jgi:hypothetical protein